MHDLRAEFVDRTCALPIVHEIAASDIWDELSADVEEFLG
jgi:hypothetical protein